MTSINDRFIKLNEMRAIVHQYISAQFWGVGRMKAGGQKDLV